MSPLPLDELSKLQLQDEGFDEGHPQWALFLADRTVQNCQERCLVTACADCQRKDICDLWRNARRLRLQSQSAP